MHDFFPDAPVHPKESKCFHIVRMLEMVPGCAVRKMYRNKKSEEDVFLVKNSKHAYSKTNPVDSVDA